MKYGIITFIFSVMMHNAIKAQERIGFEIIKSDKQETIYKGTCTFSDIEQVEAFHFRKQAERYEANPETIRKLTDLLPQYDIVLLLGTWCEDSHRLVPQFYKVLDQAGYPPERVKLFALDRDKKGSHKEEDTYGVTHIPVIILYKDSVEKGRITETVVASVEQDLLDIIIHN